MTLQQFYNAYAEWLDAGAPEDQPFSRGYGLCDNLYDRYYCHRGLMNELSNQFKEAGLDSMYPFGGEPQFDIDLKNRAMHTNPLRIQWVKDHANNQ